ncbi:hypothetical protein SAMN05216188_1173 [Lentzea xinjiangensis]|uniref:Pyrroline-5-carboxylate reductase catalytic N-terminal domain-containing protein n=1 Tax=Lentzea xinjiangensis TaxID=402600 RepID=A0A1H9SUV5_9PSEU|nr:hypothetical protein SAMN05216188_1173 [Lentzea xinjiangensis]
MGIIGGGRLGLTIARLALKAGHRVGVASTSSRAELELVLEFMAPGAIAADAGELGRAAEVTILTVPLHRYRELPREALSDRVVVDAMNYWPEVDGRVADFESGRTSSEVVQEFLGSARVVKSLNQIGYGELESSARPPGAPDRLSVAVAGDDAPARGVVAALVETLGFDALELPSLADGRMIQPGAPCFGQPLFSRVRRSIG